jgi:ketosteroid isomerase-like protein
VNAEITRRLYDAWNRRDVEGMLADVDPDIEWRPYLASVAGKPAHHLVFRNGLLLSITTHLERSDALAAAGIQR